jgi:ornithine carbamoyltransferase
VTTDVLDGPASIAFRQADNKMYSAMAVLEWTRTSGAGESTDAHTTRNGEDERP